MKTPKIQKEQKQNKYEMVNLHLPVSIITLNVNGLNTPGKRQRLSDWVKKQDSTVSFLKRDTL